MSLLAFVLNILLATAEIIRYIFLRPYALVVGSASKCAVWFWSCKVAKCAIRWVKVSVLLLLSQQFAHQFIPDGEQPPS